MKWKGPGRISRRVEGMGRSKFVTKSGLLRGLAVKRGKKLTPARRRAMFAYLAARGDLVSLKAPKFIKRKLMGRRKQ